MAIEIKTRLTLETNTGHAASTLTGVTGGLLYGFWTANKDRLIYDVMYCGILGGMVTPLIGELFYYQNN